MDAQWLEQTVQHTAREIIYETQATTSDRITVEKLIVEFAGKFARKMQDTMLDSLDAVTRKG